MPALENILQTCSGAIGSLLKLLGLLMLLGSVSQAKSQACQSVPAENPLAATLAGLALEEYARFNGHRIDADGHLWKFGSVESETELLFDPPTGRADAGQPGRFAWRRVWEYWLTLEQHRAGAALGRKVIAVPHLIEAPLNSEPATEIRLHDLLLPYTGEEEVRRETLNQAAIRAAMNDAPWSATFISFLMHRAGLDERQFHYSAAHWRYIQPAFGQSTGYAYRACDPKRTVPARGDLLCYGRGAAPLTSFEEWRSAAGRLGFSAAAHCDLVVDVDRETKKMEVVGGNVLQSVTRRKLKLNQENLLSETHYRGSDVAGRNGECVQDKTCDASDLNQQYWSVLLQFDPLPDIQAGGQ